MGFNSRFAAFAVAMAAALWSGAVPTSALSPNTGPMLLEPTQQMADALRCHETDKPAGHEPVLLVHGLTSTGAETFDWSWVPALLAEGYDVCTVDLPDRAMADIQREAEYVVHAIRAMADRFESKVDVMAVSLGPLAARWVVRWWPDVRAAVDDLVSLVGVNRGSDLSKILCADGRCVPAAWQLARDSEFVGALNSEDESPGEIHYMSIYTRSDHLAFPQFPTSVSEIEGAVNVPIDSLCPTRFPEHVQMVFDAVVYAVITDALTDDGRFDPARFDRAACAKDFMPGVTATEAAGREYVMYENAARQLGMAWRKVDAEPPLRCYARPDGCPTG